MDENKEAVSTSTSKATTEMAALTETKSSAEIFARAVVRKNVHGKLPSGSKINNVEISRSLAGGFYDHGPDQVHLSSLANGVLNLQSILYKKQGEAPDLVSTHVVSVTPSEAERGNMVLTILFFQDRKQIDSRGYCTPAHVSAELPNSVMAEFLTEIQKNPDLLEDFYQKTFVGLDNTGELPGMRRLKSNGFFLISGAKLDEAAKSGRYAFFSSLKKNQYQNGPYGSGGDFQTR